MCCYGDTWYTSVDGFIKASLSQLDSNLYNVQCNDKDLNMLNDNLVIQLCPFTLNFTGKRPDHHAHQWHLSGLIITYSIIELYTV